MESNHESTLNITGYFYYFNYFIRGISFSILLNSYLKCSPYPEVHFSFLQISLSKGQMALLHFFFPEEAEIMCHKHASPLQPTYTLTASAQFSLNLCTAVFQGGLTLPFTRTNAF